MISPTVGLSTDGALVETHDVLSKSPSLITENIFHLKHECKTFI